MKTVDRYNCYNRYSHGLLQSWIVQKVNKEIITLGDTDFEKRKFHYSKYPINLNNVDLDKMIIFIQISFGKKSFKYFISYKSDEEFKPLSTSPTKWSNIIKQFVDKSYEGKININFHDTRIPRKASQCICLSVTLTDFLKKRLRIIHECFQKNLNMLSKKKR